MDILEGREVPLGRYTTVQRMLPTRARRTVGAWCFLDHFGPQSVINMPGMRVPPHPHIGLQTVTWLLEGEIRHTDSLGSDQRIHPGALNLMTSGAGIAHAEQSPEDRPPAMHGLQLWVALPSSVRDTRRSFEHHENLPRRTADGVTTTVVLGEFDALVSPATIYTPLVGVEVDLPPGAATALPLRPDFEYALVTAGGSATVDGVELRPHALAYLGEDRSSALLRAGASGARMFLIGGEPLDDKLVMWWNFVGRSHDEIAQARADWTDELAGQGNNRFGTVHGYAGDPLPAPPLPGTRLVPRGRAG